MFIPVNQMRVCELQRAEGEGVQLAVGVFLEETVGGDLFAQRSLLRLSFSFFFHLDGRRLVGLATAVNGNTDTVVTETEDLDVGVGEGDRVGREGKVHSSRVTLF